MATDENTDQTDEAEVPETEVAPEQVSSPGSSTDDSGGDPASQETPPEQVTPPAGGEDVAVPSAAGPAGPPTNVGNAGGVEASAADEASPTGGSNIAGTPASQLDQAPPMADPSGSNIPAPNLTQPVAEGALPEGAPSSSESLDPALVDPTKAATERVSGRTSDASTRAEGTHIDEVPSDINDGVKPSDGGPEAYPFPQGGDVEVATVPAGDGAGEYLPALTVEDVVVLGEHELVPERLVGRRAFVSDAPRYLVPVGSEDQVWIMVHTRDEANATLSIPLSACSEVIRGGRVTTVRG